MGSKKRITYSAMVIMFALLVSSIYTMPVEASEPEDITLVYDFNSQTLAVNVSHYVANTKTHYIETIEIKNNDISIINRTYVNQTFNWGMYDSFTVAADNGDNLTVTATCSKGYSITSWLTVLSSTSTTTTTTSDTTTTTTTTNTTDGPDSPGTPLEVSPVVIVGIALVIFFILFFAWLEPDRFPGGTRIRAGLLWFGEKVRGAISWLGTGISGLFQKIKDKVSSK
ncbi:MAG: hypothetical protein KAJ36_02595 [Candidatus Thorarchaeota archaeon]|nr:hypothetical protein [Candidatus Thorarchaeota archaeon]